MGEAAETGHIEVLGVKPHPKKSVRSEGFADPLLGNLVSRVSLLVAVKDKNPFRLLWVRCIQWPSQQKQ